MVVMNKKISLSIIDSETAFEPSYLPYTSQVNFELTRKFKVLLDHLHDNSELYRSQIVENMILEYARSRFDDDIIDNVFNSVEPKLHHSYFDKERQIALYSKVLSSDIIHDIATSAQTDCECKLSIYSVNGLKSAATLCTESYYEAMEGFFPFEFYLTDGCYIDHVQHKSGKQEAMCDADGHHTRQLSILANIGSSILVFTPVSAEYDILVHPGDILLYPSNYSCSYYLKSQQTDGTIMRMYRLSTDESQK